MNRTPDVQLVLNEWLGGENDVAPDRILDVVADRIARQPQRRSWRLLRRTTPMNRPVMYLVGAVAALTIAVAAWTLLPRTGGVGGQPTPAPTPSSTAPTAAPVTNPPALPDGSLAPGTYRLSPLSTAPNLRIDATVPAGWQGFGSWAILGPNGTGAPTGIGIGIIAASGIFSDPCHWDAAGDGSWPQPGLAVGSTVDDLVNALVANKAYVSTTPTATTLGGFAGKRLVLQLPADISGCDKPAADDTGRYFVFTGPDAGNYAQGPGNRLQVTIVDANGTRAIVLVGDYAGTPEADRTAAQAILDSMVIMP